MANLFEETVGVLERNGKAAADVRWVGSADGKLACPWEQFAVMAVATDYDSGFGGQEICVDLVVVGDDWWLERHEYDGSEWWEFKHIPARQPDARLLTWVMDQVDKGMWSTLAEAEKGKYGGADGTR